jgi:hypothetical protein
MRRSIDLPLARLARLQDDVLVLVVAWLAVTFAALGTILVAALRSGTPEVAIAAALVSIPVGGLFVARDPEHVVFRLRVVPTLRRVGLGGLTPGGLLALTGEAASQRDGRVRAVNIRNGRVSERLDTEGRRLCRRLGIDDDAKAVIRLLGRYPGTVADLVPLFALSGDDRLQIEMGTRTVARTLRSRDPGPQGGSVVEIASALVVQEVTLQLAAVDPDRRGTLARLYALAAGRGLLQEGTGSALREELTKLDAEQARAAGRLADGWDAPPGELLAVARTL